VDRLINGTVPPGERAATRQIIFATPIAQAGNLLDPLPFAVESGVNPLLDMRIAVMGGNGAAARTASARFLASGLGSSMGTLGIDRLTAHAGMLSSLGDTGAATRQLDAALDALPRSRSILLDATPQAGAVGRAMLMRADLARHAADGAAAERWGARLATLWGAADPELRAALAEVRR
jgi:hypothetical protein